MTSVFGANPAMVLLLLYAGWGSDFLDAVPGLSLLPVVVADACVVVGRKAQSESKKMKVEWKRMA